MATGTVQDSPRQHMSLGQDVPVRAWVFALIVTVLNGSAAAYAVSKVMAAPGFSVWGVIASVLAAGLIAFNFGALREGFRLERELIKARLEMVIGTLAK